MENEQNHIELLLRSVQQENKRLRWLLIGTIGLAIAAISFIYLRIDTKNQIQTPDVQMQQKVTVQNEFITTPLPPTTVTPTRFILKNLTYSLPEGWETKKNSAGTLEVGYDPNRDKPCNEVADFGIGLC